MEDSIYIKVLEYGERVGIGGTTEPDFRKWAETIGVDRLSGDSRKSDQAKALQRIFIDCFDPLDSTEGNAAAEEDHCRYVLKTECFFRLMAYRERRESRAAASSANRHAWLAIGLSLAAMMICAVLTLAQLRATSPVSKTDLAGLIAAESGIQREVKLDRLQMVQILTALGYDRSKPGKREGMNQGREVSHHELINQYFENE